MKYKCLAIFWVLAVISAIGLASGVPRTGTATEVAVHSSAEADAMRLEGEKRFRENCNRCHAAPHKFPPRMMATIIRHMRVRATITDEDMRYILYYMTQ
jgi:cytochrome c5